jgi:tetratricopeptide (TPR) repeat protein
MADKDKEGRTTGTVHSDRATEPDEIARYEGILARESSSLVFAALAEAYRKRNMLDQAIAVCRKGLHHHPDFVSGRVALARAYVDRGDRDRATRELERVILTAPDNLIAQKLLMTIYAEKGDGDKLEGTVHRVLSLDPKDEQARKTWQGLPSHGAEDRGSEETAGRAGEIMTRTLAEIYASQGYHQKAFSIYRELSAQDPENPGIHERIADLRQRHLCRGGRTR